VEIRKTVLTRETIYGEGGRIAVRPVNRVVAIAVIENPYAGRYVEDLSLLFEIGAELGEILMPDLVKLLGGSPVAYSKAAIVGLNGESEHGHALVHPKLGKVMRAAIGGGKALICSNVKVSGPGTSIDMPFSNKDDIWLFDDFCTMTISVPDAPRPNEIALAMAVSDGGRVFARVGKGPVTT